VIAYNKAAGIAVGRDLEDPLSGCRLSTNSIYGNAIGIDLADNGVTTNDLLDMDSGPNNLQNFPLILSTTINSSSTTIVGSLNGMPSATYTLEFYSNPVCSASSYGEGKTFLGSAAVTTNSSGDGSFNLTFPTVNPSETVITSTATDPNGNASEFSACLTGPASLYTLTPCRIADTRSPVGPYGGPALAANGDRSFLIAGQCGIPATATAVSFNATITQPTALGDLRIVPGGGTLPLVSTMNWRAGQTRANNAILSLGLSGDIVVHVDQPSGTVHFIIDVNGYFQ